MNATRQVNAWLTRGIAATFPYEVVLDAYHHGGKHAVGTDLLTALAFVRTRLPAPAAAGAADRRLAAFVDAALDMHEGRFHHGTYLGLGLLPLPDPDDQTVTAAGALQLRDRLVVRLIADMLGFELNAASGITDLLPQQRPDLRTVTTRLRLGLRAITPAMNRLCIADTLTATEPDQVAQQVRWAVTAAMSTSEHLDLRLSMLPVDVVHDEYLFVRVLQACETAFALLATDLRATIRDLNRSGGGSAVDRLVAAVTTFCETAPLFSLVATMSTSAFDTFRVHTDGASAIQSNHYKLVESLCRRPGGDRLDSPAYRSTPQVRERVLGGQLTLQDAYRAAVADGRISTDVARRLESAMRNLAAAIGRWRATHHRIAVRVLGA
jgi:hypothetical protein